MSYIPNGILPERHARRDKEILNIFMVAYSISSSFKKNTVLARSNSPPS